MPVVPGSRTTEARVEPPARRRPPPPHQAKGKKIRQVEATPSKTEALQSVSGRLSANPERARNDARIVLERLVAERMFPEIPRTWKVPPKLIDGMIRDVVITPHERDYGTVYEATLKVDFSPQARTRILGAYHHEEVVKKLAVLGAVLAFVLACLAAISGYIKTDEATKGYYTNRLRMAAAAAVGAAAVGLYRWLA